MESESDGLLAIEERREIAYSLGTTVEAVPLMEHSLRAVTWFYKNIQLKLLVVVLSAMGKEDLGKRLKADNEVIMTELMAGCRGEESPTGSGSS